MRLIIDDFGTGYSALSSLRRVPFAGLKIDRCFVEEVTTLDAPAPIIRALVGLGRSLSMIVIAEGAETQVQHDFLARLGCDAVQGFWTGRPQTAHALTEMLVEREVVATAPASKSLAGAPYMAASAGWRPAPSPVDEDARLAALLAYEVLDSGSRARV